MLGAVVVHLHGERTTRLDGDAVHIKTRSLHHHVAASPRTVNFAVTFIFAALVIFQVLHDLFYVLGAVLFITRTASLVLTITRSSTPMAATSFSSLLM